MALACLLLLASCAYPRRSTPLSSLGKHHAQVDDEPPELWRLVIVEADIPREKRSGLSWDDGGGAPDPYVRLAKGDEQIWESKTLDNQLHPVFKESPPKNLAIDRNTRLRIELWDDDGVSRDPIGIYEGRALGEAILDTDTILKLEGGATLTVRVEHPEPHAGTGISLYELRKDALLVLEVLPRSPAGRAGLKPGDRITAIDGRTVENLGPAKAESALALSPQKQSELTIQREGSVQTVKLDKGHVWLSM